MRTDRTPAQLHAAWTIGLLAGVVTVVGGYALLAPRAPGGTATGFLLGGLGVLALITVDRVRVARGARTGPAARWAAGAPDERDDRILTRSLAVVGLTGILAGSAGALAWMLGADPGILLGLIPMVLLATLVVSFTVISKTS